RFGATPQGYEAMIDLAETLVELRRPEDALAATESAFAIEEAVASENKPLQGWVLEVFARASLVKTRLLLAQRDPKKALAAPEKAPDAGPLRDLLRIERAEAWARDGKMQEALGDLERVASSDPTGAVGDLALQRLAALTGRATGAVSSERALKHMNDALDRGQPSLALSQARAAFAAARVEGKKDSELVALEGMARSFEAQRRIVEARLAYEEVAASEKAPSDLAVRSALGAVRCAEQERARDPGWHALSVCERALALLERRDPA